MGCSNVPPMCPESEHNQVNKSMKISRVLDAKSCHHHKPPFQSHSSLTMDRPVTDDINDESTIATSRLEMLQDWDRQHVWHPYASIPSLLPNVLIESASGATLNALVLDQGDDGDAPTRTIGSAGARGEARSVQLVDGMSSWWAAIHGYNHPVLNAAISQQVHKMSHVMFGGLTHEPAIQLAHELCTLTSLDHCFFSDSGSVAIEVAMKMALQYWKGHSSSHVSHSTSSNKNNRPYKTKFLTVRNGYHGDTFMCMSVCDPVNGMHAQLFGTVLQQQYVADAPTPTFSSFQHFDTSSSASSRNSNSSDDTCWYDHVDFDATVHMASLRQLLHDRHDEIAAIILEPVVQGAGGMRLYHPQYLYHVRQLCNTYNVLLICDEIATGFGRTGRLLASQGHAHVVPDIQCLGKALSGGYLSLAATLCTSHVAQTLQQSSSNDNSSSRNVLMHGPTFMANPLACAVSLASLKLLMEPSSATTTIPVGATKPPVHDGLPGATTMQNGTMLQPLSSPATSSGFNESSFNQTRYQWQSDVSRIERQLHQELVEPCRHLYETGIIKDVRVMGAIGVVEFTKPIDMSFAQPALVRDYGVWLRPFGRLLYTMPPYCITSAQLRKVTHAMVSLAHKIAKR